jgi:hypothetical protein
LDDGRNLKGSMSWSFLTPLALETPAEANPIESTFATVRHRTIRSKGCLSNSTMLEMASKLVEGAQKLARSLDGHNQLTKLLFGVTSRRDRGHRKAE